MTSWTYSISCPNVHFLWVILSIYFMVCPMLHLCQFRIGRKILLNTKNLIICTVCPRCSDPFCGLSYYIKWVTTSWTYRKNSNKKLYFRYCVLSNSIFAY